MQLGHLLHEVQAQAGALAAAVGARQGVEALGQACQRVVGDGFALVEQAQDDALAIAFGGDADAAVGWCEVQGVVQQVGQCLAQQEALAAQAEAGRYCLINLQMGSGDTRLLRLQQFVHQWRQRHCHAFFQALALLHLRQVQQAFDQVLQACAFLLDIAHEALALLGRHVTVEQFGGAADGGQRAFQLVGHGCARNARRRPCLPARCACAPPPWPAGPVRRHAQ